MNASFYDSDNPLSDVWSHLKQLPTWIRRMTVQRTGTTFTASSTMGSAASVAAMESRSFETCSDVDSGLGLNTAPVYGADYESVFLTEAVSDHDFEYESEWESEYEWETEYETDYEVDSELEPEPIQESESGDVAATAAVPPPPPPTAGQREAKGLAKTLRKLLTKVETALDRSVAQGKDLEHRAEAMAANRDEVEKEMREHVSHLHGLIDHHHQLHRDMLRQRHRQCLQQLLATHMESRNFEAKLADLQKRAEDNLKHLAETADDVALLDVDVTAMWNEFNTQSARAPTLQVPQVTYRAEVPQLKTYPLADLVGCFIVSEQCSPASSPTQTSSSLKQASGLSPVPASEVAAATTSAQSLVGTALPPAPKVSGATASSPSTRISKQAVACQASLLRSETQSSFGLSSPSASTVSSSAATLYSSQPSSSASVAVSDTKETDAAGSSGWNKADMKRLLKPLLARNASTRCCRFDASSLVVGNTLSAMFLLEEGIAEIAPTEDHKAWVLYAADKRRLDLVDQIGNVLFSKKMDEVASHVASVGKDFVIVTFPASQKIVLLHGTNELCAMPVTKGLKLSSASLGSTGIAVSFTNSLRWYGIGNEKDVWIIPQTKKPKLTGICSTAVLTLDGAELVLAAVKGTQEVVIFQKQHSRFFPLSSFKGREIDCLHAQFSPRCISAHPSGLVAVLDSRSGDVVMLNVRTLVTLSVIPRERLCRSVPDHIALGQNDVKDTVYLWVCSASGLVDRVPLSLH